MNVRQLSDSLALMYGDGKTMQLLTIVSHWTKKIFDSPKGGLQVSDENDIKSLERLEKMAIVSLERSGSGVKATLTNGGKDLYWDFSGKGYYGSSDGFG